MVSAILLLTECVKGVVLWQEVDISTDWEADDYWTLAQRPENRHNTTTVEVYDPGTLSVNASGKPATLWGKLKARN